MFSLSRKLRPEAVAAKEESRYAVNTPWLSQGELVATDGRALVCLPVPPEDCEEDADGPVSVEFLKAARQSGPTREPMRLRLNGTQEELRSGLSMARPDPDGRTFPNYREIRKAVGEETGTVCLDVRLLSNIAKGLGTDAVRIRLHGDGHPMVIEPVATASGTVQEAPMGSYGMLMPISED